MAPPWDEIPEGLLRVVDDVRQAPDVSAPLNEAVLDAAVSLAQPLGSVNLVSAEDRIVSFVDLLGTKSLMQAVDDQHRAQETYDKLSSIGSLFEKCVKQYLGDCDDVEHRIISDSYVISVPDDKSIFDQMLVAIAEFQKGCLLGFGELSRGGIATGKMVVGSGMLIGKAFVDAHLLEARIASYPRIVMNNDIIDRKWWMSDHVVRDKDGMWFLSFLCNANVEECKAARIKVREAMDRLNISKNLRELQKCEWVLTYVDQIEKGHVNCCGCNK